MPAVTLSELTASLRRIEKASNHGFDTIHLQGLGAFPAVPLSEARVGDILSWNYNLDGYEIVAIRQASACFVDLDERNVATNVTTTRRMKSTRLVATKRARDAYKAAHVAHLTKGAHTEPA
jgi:hypothetical protein